MSSPNLADGFQDRITIAAWVMEAGKRGADFVADILISWGKLVAEHVQQREVYLIGAMCVRGMNLGLNVRAVVVDNVEDEMALMVVGADVASVDRHIVGDQRVGHDPLLQPKIFGRMAGIEGADSGFEFLAVAAGMHSAADVVMAEDRKSRDGVADYVVGLPQSLGPQEIIGHGYQGMEADVGYLAHPRNACVGAPAYQARN